jgi:lipopolysaccharide export system permease protein
MLTNVSYRSRLRGAKDGLSSFADLAMKLKPGTLDRYVLRETSVPVFLSVVVITLALIVINLLKLTDLVVNHGAGITQVLWMLYCLMPSVLEQTLPLATLLGVLLGVGRMSGDQELIAARACGISLYRLAMPILLLAAGICPVAWVLAMRVAPQANAKMRGLLMELTRTSGTWAVSEKVFNRNFPGITLYFDRLAQPGARLINVLVSDNRDESSPSVVVAKNAVLIPHDDPPGLTLRLHDGWVFGAEAHADNQHFVRFATYDVEIGLQEIFAGPRNVNELSEADLRAAIAVGPHHHNVWAETEIARRWMASVALFPFAALGMVLGLTRVRGGRYERLIVALAVFFVHYVMLRSGEALSQAGTVNAYLAVGFPNLVFAVAAIILFRISAADGEHPAEMVSRWLYQITANWAEPAS